MKRYIAIALFSIAALAEANRAMAQEQPVKSNVPFAFTVGGRTLPAGAYTITSLEPRALTVQSDDSRFMAILAVSHGNSPSPDAKLVFTKYGDRYFLHEVRCAQIDINATVHTSSQEKHVRSQAREAELQSEEVLVAAR